MKRKPRFGGAFFADADALYAFKSRGFGGEIGVTRASAVPPSGSRIYHPNGSKAGDALTYKLNQSVGAGHNVLCHV